MVLVETHHVTLRLQTGRAAPTLTTQPPRFLKPCKLASKPGSVFESYHFVSLASRLPNECVSFLETHRAIFVFRGVLYKVASIWFLLKPIMLNRRCQMEGVLKML